MINKDFVLLQKCGERNVFKEVFIAVLFSLFICKAMVLATAAPATAGSLSTHGDEARVSYNISGATLGSSDYSEEQGHGYYHYKRSYNGKLGSGTLTLSGTAGTEATNEDSTLNVSVSAGGEHDSYTTSFTSGTQESFSVSVPIPSGATSGSFSVSVTSTRFFRVHQIYRNDIVTVSGTFKADAEENRPPIVTLDYSPENPVAGEEIIFTAEAFDPDGDPLTYEWYLNDNKLAPESSSVRWNDPSEGEHTVRVVVLDGRGGADEDSVTFLVVDGSLQIDLTVQEGQTFQQADNLLLGALVFRGDFEQGDVEPVPGAEVELRLYSPNGNLSGSGDFITEDNGQGQWRGFFTACSKVGTWQIEATASSGSESASIERTIELEKLEVSSDQVSSNMDEIINLWMLTPDVPNGIEQDYIEGLGWPRGPKVNFREPFDERYKPYTCSSLAIKTLAFLNSIRFSPNEERRRLMAGVDYGPVNDGLGLIHVAVGLYPKSDYLSPELSLRNGYVLEPWHNQKKEVWRPSAWITLYSQRRDPTGWLFGNPWDGEYPTSGSDGGYYPAGSYEVPPMLRRSERMRVLTYSPAVVMLSDAQGRRLGKLPDETIINEIPGAEMAGKNTEEGTYVNMLSVPEGDYSLTVTGTDAGTFHLAIGMDDEILNYGEQAIDAGEEATLRLDRYDFGQPLSLPDGEEINPEPGFHDEDIQSSFSSSSSGGCFIGMLEQLR